VGIDEPPEKQERDEPRSELLGFRNRLIAGVVFAAFYIVTFGPRTGWAGGIVSGLLGGAVVFLLLREVDNRRKRRR
jgi:hypothetical protein